MADNICDSAIKCGKDNKFSPFCVSVVDTAGNIIVQKRMDGCPAVGIPKFAVSKAYACIVTRTSSIGFRDKYTKADDPSKYC